MLATGSDLQGTGLDILAFKFDFPHSFGKMLRGLLSIFAIWSNTSLQGDVMTAERIGRIDRFSKESADFEKCLLLLAFPRYTGRG